MNVAPMILRFCSGSMTPASRSRNSVDASTKTSGSCSRSKRLRICAASFEPQDAVVDEDAGQLVADRAVNDQRRDRRVDAAAQRADDAPAADLRANPRRRLLDKRRHRPVAGAAADAVREVAQDLEAAVRCARLRDETAARRAARSASAIAATGALALVATTANPAGAAATKSPWLAQTRISAGTSANSAAGRQPRRPTDPACPAPVAIVTVAWPNSRCGAGATRPPSACAISCMP